jgi:hypothetical protein
MCLSQLAVRTWLNLMGHWDKLAMGWLALQQFCWRTHAIISKANQLRCQAVLNHATRWLLFVSAPNGCQLPVPHINQSINVTSKYVFLYMSICFAGTRAGCAGAAVSSLGWQC